MSNALALSVEPLLDAADLDRNAVLSAAITGACRRIAPLWPLKNFVAVNPFLGFSNQSFHATCATLHRVARIDMLMPRDYYRQAMEAGTISDADMEAVLAAAPRDWQAPETVAALKAAMQHVAAKKTKHPAVVATIAEVLDSLAAGDRLASRTAFMINEISKWCAAYFDEGQSVWRLPGRELRPYAAWRAAMRHDLNPEVRGIKGFRALVGQMPEDPAGAIREVVDRIGVPARAIEDYLHQALLDIGGWAAYARFIGWNAERAGAHDDTLMQLLAIRVVWGYALFVQRTDPAFKAAWRKAMADAAMQPLDEQLGDDPDLRTDLLLQEAFETAHQRRLLDRLTSKQRGLEASTRPALQAAFCIDVRSEVYRRALESVWPDAETVGFAGFFGFPIEYVPIGHVIGRAHCPVLLSPAFRVCESVTAASEEENAEILGLRLLRRRVAKVWKAFKLSAVTSFVYVEATGLFFASKILSDSLALTRTVKDPNTDGLDRQSIRRLGPEIEPRIVGGRRTGFEPEERVDMAEAVLRGMSMTTRFARLVMLAGHGSTTVNNPHASGLDCGACGGNTGEANARVAAAILNDTTVREGLRGRGITIPEDTWFVGCLHDTTTDDIRIFDANAVPNSHTADLIALREALTRASSLSRLERSARLGIRHDAHTERRVLSRSRDWAQVRPEWGLAGNAAFIAAPRARTRGVDLDGRAFLHDYDWRQDEGFGVLELIMTAPMVVASWINLQYYGAVVNNKVFGSGNKVLHNVTGTIGVLEGNAGDLKIGLPWQSVHDGVRFVHEPLRLNVFIEAPLDAINSVISKHEMVRQLADNRWIHLFAIDQDCEAYHRYHKDQRWTKARSCSNAI
jgi:uncharacterized protein YbcC (UPF0753/DUF2309 family)